MIDSATVDKIYAAADIVEIIGDFIQLRKKGVNYQACCPFHNEKTPSFVVSPSKGYFKCFGCGAGGNAIAFVMKHESLSYADALKYVARKYGIEVEEKAPTPEQIKSSNEKEAMMTINIYAEKYFHEQLNETAEGRNIALSYFRERGFSDITIEKFRLGYSPSKSDTFSLSATTAGYKEEYLVATGLTIKREQGGYYDRFCGRVIFPITSFTGRIIGFGGRIMRNDKKVAKYLNSPESIIYHKSDTLYGIFQSKKAITNADKAILVEGYTDVISLHQSGVENVVASSGTSLTQGQVLLIKRLTNNVTVIYDGDSAGIKASLRGIDIILKEGVNVRVVLMPEGEDPDSFARSHTAEEVTAYIEKNEVDFLTFKSKLLISEVKDDPIGRSKVISDVVDSIAVIEDAISQSQYIAECAKLLDADRDVIASEVARRRALNSNGKAGLEVENNRRKKENFIRYQEQQQHYNPIEQSLAELYSLENEILTYLIFYGERCFYIESNETENSDTLEKEEPIMVNTSELIFSELDIDSIKFENNIYSKIFDIYRELFEKNNPTLFEDDILEESEIMAVDISEFVNNPDSEVSTTVIDLISKKEIYVASKIWNQLDDIVIDDSHSLDRAVPKSLALYKQKVVERMLSKLMQRLKDCDSSEDSLEILKQIQNLEATRKIICHKYQRIR